MSGLYVLLYNFSPLIAFGTMPATFIALPIYFISGAKKEEFLDYSSSAVIGVVWGCIYLFTMGWLIKMGMSAAIAQFFTVTVLTFILCSFHFIVTKGHFFSKIPMMFGALAACFLLDVWTARERILPLMITLVLGVALAFLCNLGTMLLAETGHWQFKRK
jgi:hypothetical protein